ncbi:B1 bradykinin receptor [Boleophthalmus pectinirostris]|uniref:B1 bradykinin receptor n=1 Tax=Boleophthalmus pectinirostris TaxID=150288 RepID=UPI000A1C55D3|nr:B1 bradykinin receptor [Boleophthalmus pectinirostris]
MAFNDDFLRRESELVAIKELIVEPWKHLPTLTRWTNNTTASTPPDLALSADWELIYALVPPYIFTISALGLLFNSFVLAVFLATRDHLTVAEIYLSNLVLADFLLMCCLPFWAMNILAEFNWPYGDALCKTVNSIIVVNLYVSILTLVMISVDRYLALVKTMKALWLRRTLYAKIICFVLWAVAVLLSLPMLIHRKVMYVEQLETLSCVLDYEHESSWKLAHQILMNLAGFALPLLVIVFCSANIIRSLSKRRTMAFQDVSDKKATALVYAVTLVFLFSWSPFQIFTFLDVLCDLNVLEEAKWYHALDIGGQVSVYLAFLNSVLNPLLYVCSGQYFRRKVRAICRRSRRGRRGSDMTVYQRSVISTYLNRTEQIKPVVLYTKEHL